MAGGGVTKLDELFVYVMTDDDGTEGVAFFETAGGVKITMCAPEAKGARALRPIAEKIAEIHGRPLTLIRFDKRHDMEVLGG